MIRREHERQRRQRATLANGASWKCRPNAKSVQSRIVRLGSPAAGFCGGTRLGS